MKDHKNIKGLLDRYFTAETSREEEAELKAYFQGPEVSEELEDYRPLFQAMDEEKELRLPDSFGEEFWGAVKHRSRGRRLFIHPRMQWVLRVAAVVLFLATVVWLWPDTTRSAQAEAIDWSQYEPETPEEALEIYQRAALKLGAALHKGTSSAAEKVKRIEDISQFFE